MSNKSNNSTNKNQGNRNNLSSNAPGNNNTMPIPEEELIEGIDFIIAPNVGELTDWEMAEYIQEHPDWFRETFPHLPFPFPNQGGKRRKQKSRRAKRKSRRTRHRTYRR